MPKVSVIIPVYNAAPYLGECLDSIVRGDLKDIELIVVDDGSSDNSMEILADYSNRYGIHVLSQSNSGPAEARNRGLDMATGEYIGFVDADDWVEHDMFAEMYKAAKEADADIVFCNLFRNQDRRMRKYIASGCYGRDAMRRHIYPLLISNLDETSGLTTLRGAVYLRLFRREMIERNGIRFNRQLVYNEDGLFCIEATLKSSCYVYLGDSYLYHNRYVAGSLTKRYVDNLWARQRGMIERLNAIAGGCDYDFAPQINKKVMEIAIYCVENLCKRDYPGSAGSRLAEVRKVIDSADLQDAIRHIPTKGLKRINRLYRMSFAMKSPHMAMAVAKYRMKKNGLR